MNTENFIKRSKEKHGDKYDYSKVEYVNNNTKVCIICPEHGEFWQTPHNHLAGHGCKLCASDKLARESALTKEVFLKRAKELYGNKYTYNLENFKNIKSIIEIKRNVDGYVFKQKCVSHLNGHDFSRKAWDVRKRPTTEDFITKSRKIHGDKYDYSKVNYVDAKTKVCIICPIHGEFWQTPYNHLEGKGCRKCARKNVAEKISKTEEDIKEIVDKKGIRYISHEKKNKKYIITYYCKKHGICTNDLTYITKNGCNFCRLEEKNEEKRKKFIEKARKVHGDKYDYSKVKYITRRSKVCIICPEHGEFWQTPDAHLVGKRCKKCSIESFREKETLSTEEFIERARKVYGDKYDYSKVNYVDAKTKVCIICPIHGEFWQTPSNHLSGYECLYCSASNNVKENRLFESIKKDLNYLDIERQVRFKWLGKQSLDIYIPKYKIAIEYQGKQHFTPVDVFGGVESFNKQRENDIKKKDKCDKNGIKVLYFTYKEKDISTFPFDVITNYNKLISAINEIING